MLGSETLRFGSPRQCIDCHIMAIVKIVLDIILSKSINVLHGTNCKALACKLAFGSGGPTDDERARVQGITRLELRHSEQVQWSYAHLRKLKHYVWQSFH